MVSREDDAEFTFKGRLKLVSACMKLFSKTTKATSKKNILIIAVILLMHYYAEHMGLGDFVLSTKVNYH